MEFTGRLAAFPASNLLQWAQTERVTGTLVVRRLDVDSPFQRIVRKLKSS
ncbi:MAG: hypothetical protein ABIV06_02440 [Thermoanaerobaculia bacterium]